MGMPARVAPPPWAFRAGVLALTVLVACEGGEAADTDRNGTSGSSSDAGMHTEDASTSPEGPSGGSASSDGSSGEAGSTGGPSGDATSDPTSDPSGDPQACPAASLPPGRYSGVELEHGGFTRTYDLYIPDTVDVTQPTPLVLNFHGLYGTPFQQAMFSQYDAAAATSGVIVAYPAGIENSWNTGLCCGGAQSMGVDDVGFARTVVQNISLNSCIDVSKVFAIGMSNGGHMAHRLACEAADVFAGVASVAGVLTMLQCQPSRPISVQQFHGTSDSIVSYGGYGPGFPAVDGMMVDWAARNGCAPVPVISHEEGDATCETWTACDDGVEVTLCTVDGGGHCWPGNASCTFGSSTTDVSANAVFAGLLATQSLP